VYVVTMVIVISLQCWDRTDWSVDGDGDSLVHVRVYRTSKSSGYCPCYAQPKRHVDPNSCKLLPIISLVLIHCFTLSPGTIQVCL